MTLHSDFFTTVYGDGTGYFAVWTPQLAAQTHFFANTEAGRYKASVLVETFRDVSNVYASLGLYGERPKTGRGKASEVTSVRRLTLDLDYGTVGHKGEKYPPTQAEALKLLGAVPPPSRITHTGNGLLVEWLLDRPYSPTLDPVALTAKAVQAAVRAEGAQAGYAVDGTFDLTRVVRVPATKNLKDRDNPKPVRVLQEDGPVYSLDAFRHLLPLVARQPRQSSGELRDGELPAAIVAEMLEYIPNEGLDYNDWLGVLMTLWAAFDESTAEELVTEWDTEGWESRFASFEGQELEVSVGLLVRLAREHGWKGELPLPGVELPVVPLPNCTTVEQEFLDVAMPDSKVVLVRSPKGTGKTEWVAKAVPAEASLLVVGHRVSLLRQQAARLHCEHYQDGDKVELGSDRLAVTIHSLMRVQPERVYRYVVLDEAEQVLSAYVTDGNLKSKWGSLAWLVGLVRSAEKVVLLDADLGPVTLAFLQEVFGAELDVASIENTVKKPLGEWAFFHPTVEEARAGLISSVQGGAQVAVACNTKGEALLIEQLLRQEAPEAKVFAITSDNSATVECQALISNINEAVKELDVLVYSPSLGTGVSIDVEHFDYVYGFAHNTAEGTGTHADFLQQLARVRTTTTGEMYLWADSRQTSFVTEPELYRQNAMQNATEMGFRLELRDREVVLGSESDCIYLALYAAVKAVQAVSKNQFAEMVKAALVAEGWEVEAAKAEQPDQVQAIREVAKTLKQAAKEERRQAVVDAPAMDEAVVEKLKTKRAFTKAERASAIKGAIISKYGVTEDEVTVGLVADDERGLLQKVRRLAGVFDSEYAIRLDRIETQGPRLGERGALKMTADRSHWTLQVEVLREALAAADIDLNGEPDQAVRPGVRFTTWAVSNAERIERVLGVQVRRDVTTAPIKTLGVLLALIGLRLKGAQQRSGKSRVRSYTLDGATLATMRRYAEHRLEVERPALVVIVSGFDTL